VTTRRIEAANVDVKSSALLTATIPGETDWIQQADGQASVVVSLSPTLHSNLVTFTYGLHVDSISPTSSPASGGSTITVTGYGFEGAPDTLAFCPSGQTSECVAADNVEVASDTSLTATIPAESGPIVSAGGRVSVAVDQGGPNHSNLLPFTYAGRVRSG
jgi:IPT/TIG domain